MVSRGHQIAQPLNPERSPEEIATARHPDIPRLRLPEPASLFRARAARLRQLAQGHTAGGYLRFVAHLADLQQQALDGWQAPAASPGASPGAMPAGVPPPAVPPREELERREALGMAPLDARHAARDSAWQGLLAEFVRALLPPSQGALREALRRLAAMDAQALDSEAQVLLNAMPGDIDAALAPFLAAALQVQYTWLAAQLGSAGIPVVGVPSRCPACGSPPVASVARIGAAEAGYRYLQCALCALEWHRVRVTCAHCGGTRGIHYQSIEDGRPARQHPVQAECCESCGSYLKIVRMDRDPHVEAVADDLATLALDLLLDATGAHRAGVNFLLIPGEAAD